MAVAAPVTEAVVLTGCGIVTVAVVGAVAVDVAVLVTVLVVAVAVAVAVKFLRRKIPEFLASG